MAATKKNRVTIDELSEQVSLLLGQLKLHAALEEVETELASGKLTRCALESLVRILTRQRDHRRERAIERKIKAARFPAHKTLDAFDFDFQTGIERERVDELATLHWLKTRKTLLFAGMSGTGKSHIAIALGHLACAAGYRVRYTTSADMLSELHLGLVTNTLNDALKPYLRCELLIVDEVGLDLPERRIPGAADAGLFFKVVANRYENQRSMILTSNIAWELWGEYLGDEIASAAILDRLAHHSYTIAIDGPSWRAHRHAQLNKGAPVGDETAEE